MPSSASGIASLRCGGAHARCAHASHCWPWTHRRAVQADPAVRLVRPDEINALFPAAVAMYTEEVGVSPLADRGEHRYRQRIADLVHSRRAYARFIDGRVVFKAELAVVTKHTAQVQGVWVDPAYRGRGLAVTGMAAVVRDALRRVAPAGQLVRQRFQRTGPAGVRADRIP